MIKFSKGAIWRKWDTHVHTPASILNHEFGSDWDEYVKILFRAALEENISAIGITDYFFIDGYKILKKDYLDNNAKLESLFTSEEIEGIRNIFIFPNIEFRLPKLIATRDKDDSLTWNRKLNYHVLLSNDIPSDYIESDFISQLHFEYNGSIGSAHTDKRPLSKENLTLLGKKLIKEHSPFREHTPLFVGAMNASIEETEIIDTLSKHAEFKDKYLLGLPADEDLSKVSWNSQGHNVRKNLIKRSHFIFSSNSNTINFFLGSDDKNSHKAEFEQIKPCIWGSDSHTFDKLFKPDNNKNTWIKADLTFEGLKQVIYDPESRVTLQPNKPQQKSGYQVIERVRFVDNRASPEFSNDWIEINSNLNTIIGGKSSGKSLLLCHIAKAINYKEASDRIQIAKASSYYAFEANSELDFEVEWADGELSKLKDKNHSKPVTYIPQLYINQLAEESGKGQLNKLIESILVQKVEYEEFLEKTENKISSLNQNIGNNISTLVLLREKSNNFQNTLDSIGSKKSIEAEIIKLTAYENQLKEASGFSDQEKDKHEKLEKRLTSLSFRLEFLNRLKEMSKAILVSIKQKYSNSLLTTKKSINAEHHLPEDSKFIRKLFNNIEENINQAVMKFTTKVQTDIQRIDYLIEKIELSTQAALVEIKPLASKVVDQSLLLETQEKIDIEHEKLKKIVQLKNKINTSSSQTKEILEVLKNQHKELILIYSSFETELNKPEFQISDDLKVTSRVSFDEEKFNNFFNAFDRRANLKPFSVGLLNEDGSLNFDLSLHHETINKIVKYIFNNYKSLPLKTSVNFEDLLRRLYKDCFSIDYVVSYLGDEILIMSPGKRGLVLLTLTLHLSHATHPILIDQPEDNLDNRTIYEQLNNHIRQRKIKRQIIMVTHNANLVVSSDAELIIVANQRGQFEIEDDSIFRFEYVGGSIENSFNGSSKNGILYQKGIREHICEILEGGINAFQEREIKYGLKH